MQTFRLDKVLFWFKSYFVIITIASGFFVSYLSNNSFIYSTSNVLNAQTINSAVSNNTFSGNFYKGNNFQTLSVPNVQTSAVNFDWGNGAPYKSLGRDNYSVKWTGSFDFAKDSTYKFTVIYDDGIRLYVDGVLAIDDWKSGVKRTSSKDIVLTQGLHTIQVDYFENTGKASVSLSWVESGPVITPPPAPVPPTIPPVPPSTSCWPSALPQGAIAGQPAPVFCTINQSGKSTFVTGANSWFDDFEHGLNFASFENTGYKVYENVGNYFYKTKHWLHNNHWMVDMAPDTESNASANNKVGGSMMRPDKTFKFENGKLVIETEYAAAVNAYDVNAWGEIVVTTASAPTQLRPAGLYAYDMFPGHYSLGLRMQPDRHTTAALMDNTTKGELEGGRLWEISFFQKEGDTVFGGGPFGGLENYWRVCAGTDPDTSCRDRFRLELTKTTFTVYVNGNKYFEQTGMPPLPDELTNGDVYVYLASISWQSKADTVRYHWDHFTVNPTTGPTPAPGFGSSTTDMAH